MQEAQKICREGRFQETITLDAIVACKRDPAWIADYGTFVKDEIHKNGNPLKSWVNREIGARVRAGIGATVKKDVSGAPAMGRVLGEIVQSYTLMQSFDADAVKA